MFLAGAGFFGWTMLRQKYTVTYDSYTATTGSISNALSFSGNLSLIDSAYSSAESTLVHGGSGGNAFIRHGQRHR